MEENIRAFDKKLKEIKHSYFSGSVIGGYAMLVIYTLFGIMPMEELAGEGARTILLFITYMLVFVFFGIYLLLMPYLWAEDEEGKKCIYDILKYLPCSRATLRKIRIQMALKKVAPFSAVGIIIGLIVNYATSGRISLAEIVYLVGGFIAIPLVISLGLVFSQTRGKR